MWTVKWNISELSSARSLISPLIKRAIWLAPQSNSGDGRLAGGILTTVSTTSDFCVEGCIPFNISCAWKKGYPLRDHWLGLPIWNYSWQSEARSAPTETFRISMETTRAVWTPQGVGNGVRPIYGMVRAHLPCDSNRSRTIIVNQLPTPCMYTLGVSSVGCTFEMCNIMILASENTTPEP